MDNQEILFLAVAIILAGLALYFRPIRKTIGLLLVILGAIASMTLVGLMYGIPMIIIGGLFLFF